MRQGSFFFKPIFMEFTFASKRSLQFIVAVGGKNILVRFGDRNQNGTAGFLTLDPNVAQAVRRNAFFRRGIIIETTKKQPVNTTVAKAPSVAEKKPLASKADETTKAKKTTEPGTTLKSAAVAPKEREYDNYTVARESICKEFGITKSAVRNPDALARVAKEHGIIIKYKEI